MRTTITTSKRVVIKVGTSSLMYANGKINLRTIERLVRVIADLSNQGREVVLVSSGAIGVGIHKLQLDKAPIEMAGKQAVAAVGQSELMHIYSKLFGEYGHVVGQVLLTRDVIDFPDSRKNVMNTFAKMLEHHIIPIVNENDTVSVNEIEHVTRFGDNDQLSAIVSELIEADLLIILSDIDGLYDSDPHQNKTAKLIAEVQAITPAIEKLAGGEGSRFGTGGMVTKIEAAQRVLHNQSKMVITNGADPYIIHAILAGKQIGTLFSLEETL